MRTGASQVSPHHRADSAPGPTFQADRIPAGRAGGEGGKADRIGIRTSVGPCPWVSREQVWQCRESEGTALRSCLSTSCQALLCLCPRVLSPEPAGKDWPLSLTKHLLQTPRTWVWGRGLRAVGIPRWTAAPPPAEGQYPPAYSVAETAEPRRNGAVCPVVGCGSDLHRAVRARVHACTASCQMCDLGIAFWGKLIFGGRCGYCSEEGQMCGLG